MLHLALGPWEEEETVAREGSAEPDPLLPTPRVERTEVGRVFLHARPGFSS